MKAIGVVLFALGMLMIGGSLGYLCGRDSVNRDVVDKVAKASPSVAEILQGRVTNPAETEERLYVRQHVKATTNQLRTEAGSRGEILVVWSGTIENTGDRHFTSLWTPFRVVDGEGYVRATSWHHIYSPTGKFPPGTTTVES
jgi:hypothetical protein